MKPVMHLKNFLDIFRHSEKEKLPEEAHFIFSDAVFPQREKIVTYSEMREKFHDFLDRQRPEWVRTNFKHIPFLFMYHGIKVIPTITEDLTDWFDIELNNYCTTKKIT